MTVTLNRSYAGYASGTVVKLTTDVEAGLIAQGLAATAASTLITPGAVTANVMSGTVGIAAGTLSVVITNSLIDANSKVFAVVAQAAADATLLRVERVVCAAGSVTIYCPGNATSTVFVDWAVIIPAGGLTIRN